MAPGSLPLKLGRVWPYTVATLIISVCYFIKLATPHSILHEIPFLIFFSGVVVCGVYGGFFIGVYSTLLSAALADYYFLLPTHTFLKSNWHQDFKLFLYIVDGVTIAGLCGSLRSALEKSKRLEQQDLISRANLQLSEEKLHSALEAAEMGSWHLDFSEGTFTATEGVAKILGRDDVTADAYEAVLASVHADDRERLRSAWESAIHTHTPMWVEYRVLRPDGKEIWVAARGNTRLENGVARYFSGVLSDITVRKRSEEALAHERHKLETIFTESPAAMVLWRGPKLVFEKLNPQYQAIFPGRRLEGLTFEEAVPELRDQIFQRILLEVLETGVPFVGREVIAKLPDVQSGELAEKFYDFTYVRVDDPSGKPYGVYVHAVDVTDRVLVRRKVEESQERLRLALNGAQMGTWSIRWPDEVLHDEKFGALHGTLPNDTVGNIILRRIHPEDGERLKAALDFSVRNRTPYSAEYRILGQDGEYRWVYARGEPKYDSEGAPISMSGVAFDIDERIRTQQALEAAKVDAERANEAKSAFLANMSHEIRTPLGAVLGFVSLLKDPTLPRDEADRYLEIIDRNSSHLLRIIDDVLDLAKVEAGKIVIERVEFSLPELLTDFASLMRLRAVENGIEFQAKTIGPIPDAILSDPTRIRQILANVVGNAIKFTSRGRVVLAVEAHGSELRFRVEDTGRGIADDQRDLLFKAFAQADSSTTRKFGGTGLGLVLTRRLAEALGGRFDLVESELGVGSVFEAAIRVEIPKHARSIAIDAVAAPEMGSAKQVKASGKTTELGGLDLLLVEDSPDNQVLIKMLVTKTGAKMTIANNGKEGVEKALAHRYDLVLMDIQMPVMDGHEAIRRLRAQGYDGPVIALTAHAMSEERTRSEQSGFTDFLSKPIDRVALFDVLRKYRPARG
jgi:PAS domain S-box-containing protein